MIQIFPSTWTEVSHQPQDKGRGGIKQDWDGLKVNEPCRSAELGIQSATDCTHKCAANIYVALLGALT